MKDLAPRRVTACYTPEEMQELETIAMLLKSKLKTPPPMADDDFDALPKMADVKRKSFGDKADVIKAHPTVVVDPTSIGYTSASLNFFDQSTKISGWVKDIDSKNWRSGDVAGFQAMNQIAFSESEIKIKKGANDPEGIEAYNELERLKPTRKAAADKTTPTDKPSEKK